MIYAIELHYSLCLFVDDFCSFAILSTTMFFEPFLRGKDFGALYHTVATTQ